MRRRGEGNVHAETSDLENPNLIDLMYERDGQFDAKNEQQLDYRYLLLLYE